MDQMETGMSSKRGSADSSPARMIILIMHDQWRAPVFFNAEKGERKGSAEEVIISLRETSLARFLCD